MLVTDEDREWACHAVLTRRDVPLIVGGPHLRATDADRLLETIAELHSDIRELRAEVSALREQRRRERKEKP